MRGRDNAPVGHTCPKIDTVIAFIDGIDCEDISSSSIKDIINVMEEIRNDNSILREWGNEMCNELDELQKDYERLDRQKEDLEKEIDYLKEEIKELQIEVDSLA